MSKPLPNLNHLLYLDGIRGVAATYVLLHHAVLQFYDAEKSTGLLGFKKRIIEFFFNGHLAVDVFIVLSGFCLMIPVVKYSYQLKGGTWFFYKKRAIRIVPTFYITIGFSLLLIWLFIGKKTGTHWDVTLPVSINSILASVLFVQDYLKSTAGKINHVFWSIFVETRIYILFPILVFLYRKINPLLILLSVIILSAFTPSIIRYANTINNIWLEKSSGVAPLIVLFVLGMFACDICLSKEKFVKLRTKLPWDILFVINSVGVFIVKALMYRQYIDSQVLDFTTGLWTVCLLVLCYNQSNMHSRTMPIVKIFSWQPLVFLGTFAYSIYLTHAPILQMITQYIIFPMQLNQYNSTIVLLIISLPICIGVAYGYFLLFEKPFLTLGKKVKLKEVEAVVAVNPAI